MPLEDLLRLAEEAGSGNQRMGASFSGNQPGSMNFMFNNQNSSQSSPQVFFMRRNNPNASPSDSREEQLTNMLGSLMRSFQNIFSGHQFLRMQSMFQGFSPDIFMTNFNSNFASGGGYQQG